MKLKNIKILTWLPLALLMVTTSCRDDTFSEYWDDANSDEYTVTINVGLEDMSPKTRGDEDTRTIGGASYIDMLVYAVYYDNNKAQGQTGEKPDWQAATEYEKKDEGFEGVDAGHGQSIINVKETFKNGGFYPLTLTLKKGQNYQVVFWAQNHETKAFVIDDLKRVQMKYKILEEKEKEVETEGEDGEKVTETEQYDEIHSVNNDERRDAFCRSISLSGDESNKNMTIYLKRPLAQINVGTRGFDFETITRNSDNKYLYSKIRINRAARYYNAVEDYTYTTTTQSSTYDNPDPSTTEAFYTIDYEYNKLPAYWKMEAGKGEKGDNGQGVPMYPSYTKYDDFSIFPERNKNNSRITTVEDFQAYYGQEEFLRVHLYETLNGGHDPAKAADFTPEEEYNNEKYYTYANLGVGDESNNKLSEVFKYLSMCYILTATDDKKGETLTNVKVWLATDEDGSNEVEIVNVNNVPVQRNHRTNIVGSLLTAEADLDIVVDDDFAGRRIQGDDDVQSGYITEGFYYDAEADEFQISSVNGLLFFQQLVNGDLLVRQVNPHQYDKYKAGAIDVPYPYFDEEGNSFRLKYQSHWKESDLKLLKKGDLDEDVANIIVKGSGYDKLAKGDFKDSASGKTWKVKVKSKGTNNIWPENNNFPFYGVTVKLMADIDLSGIEWIPIGFDCANWDGSVGNLNSNGTYRGTYNADDKIINYMALTKPSDSDNEIDLSYRRAFCGTFDGNGHTIYNMKTKRFGANVHDQALQDYNKDGNNKYGPYDNVQWFARGFFGVVGPNAVIKDLRLQNVDVQGNNAVGGIVGQVSSVGFPAKIINCSVDGGVIDAEPLYRGDYQEDKNYYGRSIARGCYIGGIVGQFVAKDDTGTYTDEEKEKKYKGYSEVTGCEVRNVTIQGYRRIGGIVGGIADQGSVATAREDIQIAIRVEKNNVVNSMIIVNQYRPFNAYWDFMGSNNSGVWQNGFGWGTGSTYSPMTDNFVGGYYKVSEEVSIEESNIKNADAFLDVYTGDNKHYIREWVDEDGGKHSYSEKTAYFDDYVNGSAGNKVSNLQYTEIKTTPNTSNTTDNGKRLATYRETIIENIPLSYIPLLTSLYVDKVKLKQNYYGNTSIKTKIEFHNSDLWLSKDKDYGFWMPLNYPNNWNFDYWKNATTYAGMYAESVEIDGIQAPGYRSVITPIGVDGINSCVLYITARNRYQFVNVEKPTGQNLAGNSKETSDNIGDKYRQPTTIKNVVLRGSPYAWAGIIMAPNMNMSEVNLENVSIYDVYKTITILDDEDDPITDSKVKNEINQQYQNYTVWPKTDTNGKPTPTAYDYPINLNVTNCNLRGYTDPGEGWSDVNFTKTTFEAGSETRYSYESMIDKETGKPHKDRNEFKTCKVKSNTTFDRCYFKAPFYIDISALYDSDKDITITWNNCYGTSAYDNVKIDYEAAQSKARGLDKNIYYIGVDKDTKAGKTTVRYYYGEGDEDYITL